MDTMRTPRTIISLAALALSLAFAGAARADEPIPRDRGIVRPPDATRAGNVTFIMRATLDEPVRRLLEAELRRCQAERAVAARRRARSVPACHFAEAEARLPDYPPAP